MANISDIKDLARPNWRDELTCVGIYKKKFALLPKECADGTKVWFKYYYSKYNIWTPHHSIRVFDDTDYHHKDFVEDITEAEYIVRKLTEGL